MSFLMNLPFYTASVLSLIILIILPMLLITYIPPIHGFYESTSSIFLVVWCIVALVSLYPLIIKIRSLFYNYIGFPKGSSWPEFSSKGLN